MLTICIPTIPARRSLLSRLLWTIQQQDGDGAFEVLIAEGAWPLGDKVNTMFAAAEGTHVVVVDDDDNVSNDYMRRVCEELRYPDIAPDMIGYHLLWTEQGRYMASPLHHGDGHPDRGVEDRGASVKTPTRVEIARAHPMGNDYYADNRWAHEVHPEITTHLTIRRHMYLYDHWNDRMVGTDLAGEQSSWYQRPQRNIGEWPYDPGLFTWIGSGA